MLHCNLNFNFLGKERSFRLLKKAYIYLSDTLDQLLKELIPLKKIFMDIFGKHTLYLTKSNKHNDKDFSVFSKNICTLGKR